MLPVYDWPPRLHPSGKWTASESFRDTDRMHFAPFSIRVASYYCAPWPTSRGGCCACRPLPVQNQLHACMKLTPIIPTAMLTAIFARGLQRSGRPVSAPIDHGLDASSALVQPAWCCSCSWMRSPDESFCNSALHGTCAESAALGTGAFIHPNHHDRKTKASHWGSTDISKIVFPRSKTK